MSYTTVSDLFKAICDSIRTKTGKSGTINHQDIPAEIDAIEAGGDVGQFIFVNSTIETVSSDENKAIRDYAFYKMQHITTLDLPNAYSVGGKAFYYALANDAVIRLPAVRTIGYNAFEDSLIGEGYFPALTKLEAYAFLNCYYMTKLRMPLLSDVSTSSTLEQCNSLNSIDAGLITNVPPYFVNSMKMKVVALRSSTAVVLSTTAQFNSNSPIVQGTGYVLIPRSLIATYQAATNWSTLYAAGTQFLALEDYTTDGTLTGELDETKIDALLAS